MYYCYNLVVGRALRCGVMSDDRDFQDFGYSDGVIHKERSTAFRLAPPLATLIASNYSCQLMQGMKAFIGLGGAHSAYILRLT